MELPDIGSIVSRAVEAAIRAVRSWVLSLVRPIWRSLSNLWGWVRDRIKDITEWVGERIKEISDWVNDRIKDISDWVGNALRDLSNWVNQVVGDVVKWVRDRILDISKWVSDRIRDILRITNRLRNALLKLASEFWELARQLPSVVAFLIMLPINIAFFILDKLGELIDGAIQAVTTWSFEGAYSFAWDLVVDNADQFFHLFEDPVRAWMTHVEDVYITLFQNITHGFDVEKQAIKLNKKVDVISIVKDAWKLEAGGVGSGKD